MTLAEFLAENARFMQPADVELVEGLTDAELAALLDASEHTGLGGDDLGALVVTHETLADFDASRAAHWNERGSREAVECAGFAAVAYSRFQMLKGQPRVAIMVVVDLGSRRIAVR